MKTKTELVKSFATKESTIIVPIFEEVSFQKTGLKDLDELFQERLRP